LAKEDIGVIVMANGVEMTRQAQWVSKILVLSTLVEDLTGMSIHSVRDGMPDIMKKLVKGTFKMWAEFYMTVKAVSDEEIDTAIAEERRISTVEDELRKLRAQLQAQQSPQPLLRLCSKASTSIVHILLPLPLCPKPNSSKVVQ
jgi:hypothetical protein